MSVVLALVSGLLHATWNTMAKRTGRPRGATLAILTYACLFALGALFVVETPRLPRAALPWMLVAGLGEAAYVWFLGKAYEKGDLAITYAVSRAVALIVIWPMSFAAFGSVPSWVALGATALVVVAMWLARSDGGKGAGWSVGFTVATGVAVAVYHTGYKGAAVAGATPTAGFLGAISLALPLLWLLSGREVRSDAVRSIRAPLSVLSGALCAASFILMIVALTHADSGRILGVRNSSVGFAALFAFWLGERPSRRQWLALLLLAGGIALFAADEALRH